MLSRSLTDCKSLFLSPVRYIDMTYRLSIYRHFCKISISISILIWSFLKISISISIRQFCKISISIKYRIDSNLAYQTGLPYRDTIFYEKPRMLSREDTAALKDLLEDWQSK